MLIDLLDLVQVAIFDGVPDDFDKSGAHVPSQHQNYLVEVHPICYVQRHLSIVVDNKLGSAQRSEERRVGKECEMESLDRFN